MLKATYRLIYSNGDSETVGASSEEELRALALRKGAWRATISAGLKTQQVYPKKEATWQATNPQ